VISADFIGSDLLRSGAPKGASNFEELAASLKRCPDTNLPCYELTVPLN
jgi:hypothetical protein